MVEGQDKNQVYFDRARRNFLIVSVILLIDLTLGLTLEERLNLLIGHVTVENSEHLKLLLWIAWAWFLVRYFLFYQVVEHQEFKNLYYHEMNTQICKAAVKKMQRELRDQGMELNYNRTLVNTDIVGPRAKWCYQTRMPVYLNNENGSQTSFNESTVPVSGIRLIWPKIRSHIRVYTQTPHLTEYLVPFFLAGVVGVWGLIQLANWYW